MQPFGDGPAVARLEREGLEDQEVERSLRQVERLVEGFRARYGLADDALRDEELEAARRLVAERYGADAWTGDLP